MATESIQMNVVIKDKTAGKKLANALEQAVSTNKQENNATVSYVYANKDEIRSMFKNAK